MAEAKLLLDRWKFQYISEEVHRSYIRASWQYPHVCRCVRGGLSLGVEHCTIAAGFYILTLRSWLRLQQSNALESVAPSMLSLPPQKKPFCFDSYFTHFVESIVNQHVNLFVAVGSLRSVLSMWLSSNLRKSSTCSQLCLQRLFGCILPELLPMLSGNWIGMFHFFTVPPCLKYTFLQTNKI